MASLGSSAPRTCHGGRCAPRAPPRTPHAAHKRRRRSVSGLATAAAPRSRSRVAPAQSARRLWQLCTRRTAATGRCDLSRGQVAGGGRGLREPGERKLPMRPRERLVARNVMARSPRRGWHGRGGGWGGAVAHLQIKKRARARAVGRHAGAWRGLRDRGGLVAALHVREGRAPSATAARAPAWPTPCGQVCSWRHRPLHALHCGRLCALEPPLCEKGYPNAMSDTRVVHVLR